MRTCRRVAAPVAVLIFAATALAAGEEDAALRHARKLLASTILVDGHPVPPSRNLDEYREVAACPAVVQLLCHAT